MWVKVVHNKRLNFMKQFFSVRSMKKSPGFSLGEVILASFVLTVGIISVVKIMASSYSASEETQDLMIAAELAQEGVELVRNIRDNEIARKVTDIETNGSSSIDVLGFLPNSDHSCIVDYLFVDNNGDGDIIDDGEALDCGGAPDSALGFNAGLFYAHNGANSGFYRRIKIDKVAGTSARVLSLVTWQNPSDIPQFLNGSLNNAISSCTIENKCVYTELLLTTWR